MVMPENVAQLFFFLLQMLMPVYQKTNECLVQMPVNDALRVHITIVYEHIVCATSAFSMCMLRVVLTSFCFDFSMTLQAIESCSVCFCIIKT